MEDGKTNKEEAWDYTSSSPRCSRNPNARINKAEPLELKWQGAFISKNCEP